ncbi:Zinc finger protein [Pseudolycoriella hygida]|uniref:Zinc finger protein n=1 Tax=Pseudolycoriella hygida TaxID=35572 RepID=A0A9Q0N3Z7_9DIPT|nr:Zinc finger protein [Pseudolycoriella hygida]
MKKAVQPIIRKVYGQTSPQDTQQMNTVRKINSLLSSGAVSVTGPTQSRLFKQKVQPVTVKQECYICDEVCGANGIPLTEALTTVTHTKIPNKIGRVVGDEFMVIISVDDLVCKRCLALFNQMDRLEHDLERVRGNILNFINKKYKLTDNDNKTTLSSQPPTKLQRLNASGPQMTYSRKTSNGEDDEVTLTRKVATMPTLQAFQKDSNEFFDSNEKQNAIQTSMGTQIRQHTTITPVQAKKTQMVATKMYKCVSCDFKTCDLKEFTPHYDVCKAKNSGFRCKICKKLCVNSNALKAHMDEKHSKEFVCSICCINYINEVSLKKHMETNHPDVKAIETAATPIGISQLLSCNQCNFKTNDKQGFDEHVKKHNKVKPFKCRICAMRFETRDLAAVHAKTHQPDYFKCGKCSVSFPQRDLLVKHFETHKQSTQIQNVQQVQQTQQPSQQDLTTQKLLQETIDEALRGDASGEMDPKIDFFSCNTCSLTFIQENYYNQHMETHKREEAKKSVPTTNSQSLIRQEVRNTNATILHTQTNSISDADIESMFEKMHSDKVETEGNSNSSEMVITSQQNSVGGISFSITIPQQEDGSQQNSQEGSNDSKNDDEANRMGIDMPNLDHADDQAQLRQSLEQQEQHSGPVSMPSLDDDGDDSSHPSNTEQIPMDLDDMQNAAESGQIKFIMNEDGQILQLDNHIITTDADGNQILVQGTDSEQIQQLLQSVGVLQAGEGDGETYQMIQGENNQMIIVQGEGNEAQIIDASMLNEDGHLVIQHNENDELPEGMHIVNEDGVQVPVSIAFASQQQHEQMDEDGAVDQQQQMEEHDADEHKGNFMQTNAEEEVHETTEQNNTTANAPVAMKTEVSSPTHPVSSTTGEGFFTMEDLLQPEQKQSA